MRNMSFIHTQQQIRDRTKTVTRRRGWWHLKPGELVQAVEKSQGIKKGEKIRPICTIRIVSTSREPLRRMADDTDYGFREVEREGFKDHPQKGWPSTFVEWFASSHGCTINDDVNRIEFEYIERPSGEKANERLRSKAGSPTGDSRIAATRSAPDSRQTRAHQVRDHHYSMEQ